MDCTINGGTNRIFYNSDGNATSVNRLTVTGNIINTTNDVFWFYSYPPFVNDNLIFNNNTVMGYNGNGVFGNRWVNIEVIGNQVACKIIESENDTWVPGRLQIFQEEEAIQLIKDY